MQESSLLPVSFQNSTPNNSQDVITFHNIDNSKLEIYGQPIWQLGQRPRLQSPVRKLGTGRQQGYHTPSSQHIPGAGNYGWQAIIDG